MSVTALDDYRTKNAGRDILGLIVWCSARKALVPLSDIKADLEAIGLGSLVPKPTSASDQWRKSIRSTERTGVELDGKLVNILTRKLVDNKDEIVRSLVIETVDAEGRKLGHEEAAHLIFTKETKTGAGDHRMRVRRLVDVGGVADHIIQEVRDTFAARMAHGGCKDHNDLRSLLQGALVAHKAVTVRETGGVYFVPREHAEIVGKLETLAATWAGTDLHSLPLIDDEDNKQRGMVSAGVTDSVIADVDSLLAEMRKQRDSNQGISDRRAATYIKQGAEIRDRIEAYRDLLEDGLDDAGERLQVLELALETTLKAAA